MHFGPDLKAREQACTFRALRSLGDRLSPCRNPVSDIKRLYYL